MAKTSIAKSPSGTVQDTYEMSNASPSVTAESSESKDPLVEPTEHVVEEGETLSSVAAKYSNLTPSQLASYNRLSSASAYIYPGQTLSLKPRISPVKHTSSVSSCSSCEDARKSTNPEFVEDSDMFDDPFFVRLSCRHLKKCGGDGLFWGSLMLTDKSVIFTPNMTDLLIHDAIEEENVVPEYFQLVIPSELVVNIALFSEFHSSKSVMKNEEEEKEVIKHDLKNTVLSLESLQPTEGSRKSSLTEVSQSTTVDGHQQRRELFLRIVCGQKTGDISAESTLPPFISYGESEPRPEYWFLISSTTKHNRVSGLVNFISNNSFTSKIYGPLNLKSITEDGYTVFDHHAHANTEETETAKECLTRDSISDLTLYEEVDCCLIGGPSHILEDRKLQISPLERHFPARVVGADWHLKYSTVSDGYSLNHLYTRMSEDDDCPCLLLIKDTAHHIFGAYLSSPIICDSKHVYGTGETFVFKFINQSSPKDQLQVYKWSGENELYFQGTHDSFFVGSSNGRFAIWVDSDLNQGRTEACDTFNSEPLSENKDFIVQCLECWALH